MDDLNKKWALVLEDEPLIALELEDALGLSGFDDVRVFYSFHPAFQELEISTPDIAIIDYRIRGRTSECFAALLSARSVPLLVYSGTPYEKEIIPTEFDRSVWLMKPQSTEHISKNVRNLLSPPAPWNSGDIGRRPRG